MPTAYLGMGANLPGPLGPPDATLARAAVELEGLGRMAARSSLYSTAPVGFADQPRFTNAVVALETSLAPLALLDALLELERWFGRNRLATPPKGPRTLDLDILLLGDITVRERHLEIPHPRLAERAFVLVPLAEIAPRAVEPRSGRTVAELLDALAQTHPGELRGVVRMASALWLPRRGPSNHDSIAP